MIETESVIIDTAIWIAAAFTFIGTVFGLIRLVQGPFIVDRIVALDFISFVAVACISLMTIFFNQPLYLDVAIILALLGFLATIALARYAERRLKKDAAGLEECDD